MPVRLATSEDLPFLQQMLYAAVYWRPGVTGPPIAEALSEPYLAMILAGWGRTGDVAFIATDTDDDPIGAVWLRLYTEAEHAFGFIDAQTPELGLAVLRGHRGAGVGTALLTAAIDAARAAGHPRLSVSVEASNPARQLYEHLGFTKVCTNRGAWTMQLDLDSPDA